MDINTLFADITERKAELNKLKQDFEHNKALLEHKIDVLQGQLDNYDSMESKAANGAMYFDMESIQVSSNVAKKLAKHLLSEIKQGKLQELLDNQSNIQAYYDSEYASVNCYTVNRSHSINTLDRFVGALSFAPKVYNMQVTSDDTLNIMSYLKEIIDRCSTLKRTKMPENSIIIQKLSLIQSQELELPLWEFDIPEKYNKDERVKLNGIKYAQFNNQSNDWKTVHVSDWDFEHGFFDFKEKQGEE